jgi:hypothetical protein
MTRMRGSGAISVIALYCLTQNGAQLGQQSIESAAALNDIKIIFLDGRRRFLP